MSVKERDRFFGVDVEEGVIKKEVRYQVNYEIDPGTTGSTPATSV